MAVRQAVNEHSIFGQFSSSSPSSAALNLCNHSKYLQALRSGLRGYGGMVMVVISKGFRHAQGNGYQLDARIP
jgi:hypothetical protein